MIGFSDWREDFLRALHSGEATDVPCDGCTACCRSGQFVLIEADERAPLDRIPAGLLAPAPDRRDGAMVMGYRAEDGACPMLGRHGCTIYDARPRTCRTYDCRIFAATGVVPEQPLIAARVRDWEFDSPPARTAATARAADLLERGEDRRRAALSALDEPAT